MKRKRKEKHTLRDCKKQDLRGGGGKPVFINHATIKADDIKPLQQGPTGRGFQLLDGLGSGIGKNISGRIGY